MSQFRWGPGNCVAKAVYVIFCMRQMGFGKDEIRVHHYPTEKPGVNHVQVQIFRDGEWHYMTLDDWSEFPKEWTRHFPEVEGKEWYEDGRTFILNQMDVNGI